MNAAYLLESAFCAACFYGYYWFALRRETFFQWNRAYLLLTPLLSMLLPALHIRLGTSKEHVTSLLPYLRIPFFMENCKNQNLLSRFIHNKINFIRELL
jgi:hypothetical protein